MQPYLRFDHVCRSFDGIVDVVHDLTLDVARGEFLTLLGPSGSGKTTTLMMLAGFERPDGGEILLDGAPITRLPPHRRNIGVVVLPEPEGPSSVRNSPRATSSVRSCTTSTMPSKLLRT